MKKYLILIIALALFPALCFAGTLQPDTETSMTQVGGTIHTLAGTVGGTSKFGTIPVMSGGYYGVEIYINIAENGLNPTGTAGVSVFVSGTTEGAIRKGGFNVNATDLVNYSAQGDTTTGVTDTLVYENVYEITIGGGYDTAGDSGNFTSNVNYRRWRGQY